MVCGLWFYCLWVRFFTFGFDLFYRAEVTGGEGGEGGGMDVKGGVGGAAIAAIVTHQHQHHHHHHTRVKQSEIPRMIGSSSRIGSRFKYANPKPQTTNHKPQTTNHKPQHHVFVNPKPKPVRNVFVNPKP